MPATVAPTAVGRIDPTRVVRTIAGEALGTSWRVSVAADTRQVEKLRRAIEARLAGVVAEMSQWEPTSLLSRFNRSPAGSWTALPADFAAVITAALAIAERSGGAFDPTHGRAAALLGFGAEAVTVPPSAAALDEVQASAGWRRLGFDAAACRLRQPGGLWLDLSGIGKGFAVDAVADLLRREGFDDALVEIGGELSGRGLKPDGQPWWVDLEPPPGTALPPFRVALHELAVATSGDYVRGAHTLDPRTGRPLMPGVIAVSVLHRSALIADAWATALTVLGRDGGAAIAKQEGLAARIVSRRDGTIVETLTPALAAMLDG